MSASTGLPTSAILIVELMLLALKYATVIWLIVDVRRHDDADFERINQTRSLLKILSSWRCSSAGGSSLVYYLVARRPMHTGRPLAA